MRVGVTPEGKGTPSTMGEQVLIHKNHWWNQNGNVTIPTGYTVLFVGQICNCSLGFYGPFKGIPVKTCPLRPGDLIKVTPDTKWVGWSFLLIVERPPINNGGASVRELLKELDEVEALTLLKTVFTTLEEHQFFGDTPQDDAYRKLWADVGNFISRQEEG